MSKNCYMSPTIIINADPTKNNDADEICIKPQPLKRSDENKGFYGFTQEECDKLKLKGIFLIPNR